MMDLAAGGSSQQLDVFSIFQIYFPFPCSNRICHIITGLDRSEEAGMLGARRL